jgi:LmbE family N-acetylglucosaminyl deacetylase
MENSNSILVFGAHPDDLEIGMGGTISKLVTLGFKVIPIIATLPNFTENDTKSVRQTESVESSKILGCQKPEFLDLSPTQINFDRKLVFLVDNLIKKYQPCSVFTQWIGDSHQDHQILTKSVISASRGIDNLYMYETTIPGGITEQVFKPQLYIDITNNLETKKQALLCYKSQFLRCGHYWIEAIVGRCSYRGYQINAKYAEVFEIIKTRKF